MLWDRISAYFEAATERLTSTTPEASAYTWNDIMSLAKIAKATYANNNTAYFDAIVDNAPIAAYDATPEITKPPATYYEDRNTDAEVYIFYYRSVLCISFRGSTEIPDFYHDFRFAPQKTTFRNTPCAVHSGFYAQFSALKAHINTAYTVYCSRVAKPRVLVTGHSLGSALATVAALYIRDKYPDSTVDYVGFGTPRVGDRCFVETFNNTVTQKLRIINDNDIVNTVPLVQQGYHHVDALVLMLEKKNSVVNAMAKNRFVDAIIRLLGLANVLDNVAEHMIDAYILRIKAECA